MDGIFHELGRRTEPAKLLGYLNFSDGKPDYRFQKGIADAYACLAAASDPTPWQSIPEWLSRTLVELAESGSAAFRESGQAGGVLAALARIPAAYRSHHADLLARQTDADLFGAFFLARAAEAVLRQGGPWDETDRLTEGAITTLNDYVGYRPIAILETRPNTDYYSHEKVRPVPIYLKNAGTAPGKYADLIKPALELLATTGREILDEACFDPDRLEELAFDPRAHDHFHPLNKRPNVLFGEWDPQTIDSRGFYSRFVLRQMTLDTLLQWVDPGEGQPDLPGNPGERLFEAAAVLAGTILMGSGVSGFGPTYHDSTVTLSKLVPRIARYRDGFYKRLVEAVQGAHGERLRAESAKRQQAFAGARQFLNQAIAGQRAAHLQDRRLAQLFAAMGYPVAARERAEGIPAPAVRFATEIRARQTEAGFAADRGDSASAARLLAEVEDLLHRGIGCGAIIDPWNILGFQGLFPIFPGREDTVRDPRAEDLILTVGRQFDLYSRAIAAASVGGGVSVQEQLALAMQKLADWWDRFATSTVAELPRIVGSDRVDAAGHVAQSLAAWARRDPTGNDLAFWRQHRDGFTSPAAFARVIEALIETGRPAGSAPSDGLRAAMALLMTWLSENGTIPLDDPSAAFDELAEKWLRAVIATASPDRLALIRRFFELLEANADDLWLPPELDAGDQPVRPETDEDVEDDDEFASAYEGVTFRDSADDGEEGSVADGDPAAMGAGFILEGEAERLEERLKFLLAVARLWRAAARPDLWARRDDPAREAVTTWLATARSNQIQLSELLDRIRDVAVPEPVGGHEGMIEFDRRRVLKGHLLDLGVATCVETGRAALSLSAVLAHGGELTAGKGASPPAATAPGWEPLLIRIERAIGAGDPAGVRRLLPGFVDAFRQEPLLYCPPSDGGKPEEVLRSQTALHVLEDLLTRLPRLGLLRETFHLTRLARQMEWNSPPEGRRVSTFDQLFRTALAGVVDALVAAADGPAHPSSPLSGMLFQVAEAFQEVWKEHSKSLRLSVLESVTDAADWDGVRQFVTTYGSDLFTVSFLGLSNMRGIIARGVEEWLDHEVGHADPDRRPKLIDDWEDKPGDRPRVKRAAEVVLQALVEHYDEYRDYNTTTTQSDYGENLHILLDFLRLKVRYDRAAWRLRPFAMAHEVLCRRGRDDLAGRWRAVIEQRTRQLAAELLEELGKKENSYGVRLRTIRDRLEEKFVFPLEIDRAAAQVGPAADAARAGERESEPAFARLLAAVAPLASTVSGVGLEVPVWVRRLEDALRESRDRQAADPPPAPIPGLDLEEARRQLADWDRPLGE